MFWGLQTDVETAMTPWQKVHMQKSLAQRYTCDSGVVVIELNNSMPSLPNLTLKIYCKNKDFSSLSSLI